VSTERESTAATRAHDEATRAPMLGPAFVALLAVNVAFSFALSTFFLLPKYMVQELGASPSDVGAVATGFGLTMVVAVPLIGRLLDGSRDRAVLIGGAAVMAVSALGFVFVTELGPSILVLRALQGIALSMFNNAGSVIVAELAPVGRMAQALGLFAGTGMVMTAVAPALVELIAERAGYTPSFALAAGASLVAVALAFRVPRPTPKPRPRSSLRTLLGRATSLRMIGVLAGTGLGFGVMFSFSSPFALALGIENVRGFFVAFAVGAVLVRFGLGGSIDRIGPRRVATFALAGYGASVGAMCLLAPGRLELLGALFGLFHGLFIPAFTAFVVSEAEAHERGKVMSLFNGAFNLGNCLVVGLGMIAEIHGFPLVFGATGLLVLLGPPLLAGWPRSRALTTASA